MLEILFPTDLNDDHDHDDDGDFLRILISSLGHRINPSKVLSEYHGRSGNEYIPSSSPFSN